MRRRLAGAGPVAVAVVAALALAGCARRSSDPSGPQTTRPLSAGWSIRAAADVAAGGETISLPEFEPSGWHAAEVPTTVLAALVANGLYPDPYRGMNLERIPSEPFGGPWWYRTTFELAETPVSTRVVFHGLNYRAAVWVNGHRLAGEEEMLGAFKRFELDTSAVVRRGRNALAVEVHPPRPGDFTVGFVDWNPTAPDRNMGLWRGVDLRLTGAVSVDGVFVSSEVDLEGRTEAAVTVAAELRNWTDRAVEGRLVGEIEGRRFEAPYSLGPAETGDVVISGGTEPALHFAEPRLWWPHDLGEPQLYTLELTALDEGGAVSDHRTQRFGVRRVEDYLNADGHRGYRVNGRDLLIRGGGWVDDLMLVEEPARLEAQLRYARHLRFNTLRLEGFWGSSERLYDLADELGLLLMVGWSCQWEWEEYLGKEVDDFGGVRTDEDIALVSESWGQQVRWLRNHPSIFVWVLASDKLPRPSLERRYVEAMATADPTRPLLAACAVSDSEVSGPTGVKMNGPYEYVTPNYWYVDTERGGAFGFNTETGPGAQPPPLESLRRMLGDEHLWPMDEVWEYHCGRHQFHDLRHFQNALDGRYGPSASVEEFAQKSQVATYEAMRAMFEAFAVRRPKTTGIIQWMFNSAWPALFWQLYDYYLLPNGAFYGARVASAAASLVYDYGDGSVYAVSDGTVDVSEWSAEVRMLDAGSQVILSETVALPEVEHSVRLLGVSEARKSVPVSFLDLRLRRADGSVAARNFYWLSAEEDRLDPENSTWYVTPNASFADFTALEGLPPARLRVSTEPAEAAEDLHGLLIRLQNPGEELAFFVELSVFDRATGESIVPVFFDDNYVSILPREERQLTVRFPVGARNGAGVGLRYSGWNVEAGEV